MAKETTYGPHVTRGGVAVLDKIGGTIGGKSRLAERVKGPRDGAPLSAGTLVLLLRGFRRIDRYAAQIAEATGVDLAWFSQPSRKKLSGKEARA